MFDGFAVPEANEMHVSLLHRAAGRRYAHQGSVMGAVHGQAARDGVPFSDQFFDREVQVREGRAQHGDQLPYRLGTAISSRMRLVIDTVRGDQLVSDSEIPPVQPLLVHAAKCRLVPLFSGHGRFLLARLP